jgi:BMFP domain-containing protein YqiC
MNLFARIFDDPEPDQGPGLTSVIREPAPTITRETTFSTDAMSEVREDEEDAPSPFSDYVKSMILTGSPPEGSYEEDLDFYDTEEVVDEEDDYLDEEDEEDEEDEVVEDEDLDLEPEEIFEEPDLSEPPTPTIRRTIPQAPITEEPSSQQIGDAHVEEIVDGLFDKLKNEWGPRIPRLEDKQIQPPRKPRRKSKPEKQKPEKQSYALATTKHEMSQMIRDEVPRALKGEFLTILRTEIMRAVRGEISRVVREEFEPLTRTLEKTLDSMHALEARMAKIEGSVEKEVQVNFPEGAIHIDAPITIPEREVKIAAPINVQPPSVTFDEGAISVTFKKESSGKRQVKFDRDPYDNCVKSAEIIDVPAE